jgi:hypothetical protein
MKTPQRIAFASLALALAAAAAGAQPKPAPAPPAAAPGPPAAPPAAPPAPVKPAPELDTLKVFLGRWRCDGKAFAGPLTPAEHGVSATAEGKLEADRFWQSFSYEERKTKDRPGFKLQGFWGYDQGSKRFVRAAIGNHGEWDTASSPGWEGDKLIWSGELSGDLSGQPGRLPFRHTFTKKGDRAWTHLLEVRLPDGKWVAAEEVSCKK